MMAPAGRGGRARGREREDGGVSVPARKHDFVHIHQEAARPWSITWEQCLPACLFWQFFHVYIDLVPATGQARHLAQLPPAVSRHARGLGVRRTAAGVGGVGVSSQARASHGQHVKFDLDNACIGNCQNAYLASEHFCNDRGGTQACVRVWGVGYKMKQDAFSSQQRPRFAK
jgi:hypothetical protein